MFFLNDDQAVERSNVEGKTKLLLAAKHFLWQPSHFLQDSIEDSPASEPDHEEEGLVRTVQVLLRQEMAWSTLVATHSFQKDIAGQNTWEKQRSFQAKKSFCTRQAVKTSVQGRF